MKSFSKYLILLFFVSAQFSFAQKLTRAEMKILKSVETNNAEAIQFLKDVVNINSGTMNHDGVKKVGDVFGEAFKTIGFQTK